VSESTSCYPSLSVDTTGTGVVSQAGAVMLLRTAEKTGLGGALSVALAPWRKSLARHDPGKILLDLAVSVAVGGDCLADIALLREESGAGLRQSRISVGQQECDWAVWVAAVMS